MKSPKERFKERLKEVCADLAGRKLFMPSRTDEEIRNEHIELLRACRIVLAGQESHRWKFNSDELDGFEIMRQNVAKCERFDT